MPDLVVQARLFLCTGVQSGGKMQVSPEHMRVNLKGLAEQRLLSVSVAASVFAAIQTGACSTHQSTRSVLNISKHLSIISIAMCRCSVSRPDI